MKINDTSDLLLQVTTVTTEKRWCLSTSNLSAQLILNSTHYNLRSQGVDHGGWGGPDPRKYVGGVRVCFAPVPPNVTFIRSKLLDNSASFTSWRMKDLCQKWEGKTNISRHPKRFVADWPRPIILRQLYATVRSSPNHLSYSLGDEYSMNECLTMWY